MELPQSFTPRNWHHDHKQKLTTGERAADRMRNSMGSWTFVLLFLAFMGVWAFINSSTGLHHWDNYPFILLNLFLSMLAGLQGAILLIAAKRADAISAAMAAHDYETNRAAKRDIEHLMEMNQKQFDMLIELQKQLESRK
ncbi:MAG: DUF1003 domain-containing protein [Candidatus Saccharimonadales bacterium]